MNMSQPGAIYQIILITFSSFNLFIFLLNKLKLVYELLDKLIIFLYIVNILIKIVHSFYKSMLIINNYIILLE